MRNIFNSIGFCFLGLTLFCSFSLYGMASDSSELTTLTMAQHQELVDFARHSMELASFPELCALCEEVFPTLANLARMYVYLQLNYDTRTAYEGTPWVQQLKPYEFLMRCPDFSFVKAGAVALESFAKIVRLPRERQQNMDCAVINDIFSGLLVANDVVCMRYLRQFLAGTRADADRFIVGDEDSCMTIFTGSIIGARLLTHYSDFDVSRRYCYERVGDVVTPLMLAVMRGSLPIVNVLLKHDADPEVSVAGSSQQHAIADAVKADNADARLIEKKDDIVRYLRTGDGSVFVNDAQREEKRLAKKRRRFSMGASKVHDTDDALRVEPQNTRRRRSVGAGLLEEVAEKIPDCEHRYPGYALYKVQYPRESALSIALKLSKAWQEQEREDNPYPEIVACLRAASVACKQACRPLMPAMMESVERVGDDVLAGSSSGPVASEAVGGCTRIMEETECVGDGAVAGPSSATAKTLGCADDDNTASSSDTSTSTLIEGSEIDDRQPTIVDFSGCWCHHAKKHSDKDKRKK